MFQFDRYIQDNPGKSGFFKDGQKLKYYLMPFGSGSSMCPGRHFAINEIKQFLCLMLLYFDLELDPGQTRASVDSSRAGLGILFPSTNVRFRYKLRWVLSGDSSGSEITLWSHGLTLTIYKERSRNKKSITIFVWCVLTCCMTMQSHFHGKV